MIILIILNKINIILIIIIEMVITLFINDSVIIILQ